MLTSPQPSDAHSVQKLPQNVEVDTSPDDVASSLPQSRAISSIPTPVEVHDEDLGDTMSRPKSTATQERLDIHTVSSSVAPLQDDTVMDTGVFSLSTELQPDNLVGKSVCTVSHSLTHLKYV